MEYAHSAEWTNGILAMAGYWEPVSFMIRGGRSHIDITEDTYPYSEQMADKLQRIGVNLVVWHYYKGLGIKSEEEEMARTAEFFTWLDKRGIRKGTYINFGSFFADTFLAENPEAEKWLAKDMFGLPHQYSEYYRCYYRLRPCMSNKEFADYVGMAALKAINEAKADLIQFDNSAQMPCYCENCKEKFPEYVLDKFPVNADPDHPISFKERFGYNYTGRLEMPRGTARMPLDSLPGAHEPGLYEYIRYRQNLYECAHQRVTKMIRHADKDVAIGWNIALDYGEFPGLVWGLDPETAYRSHSNFFFSEDEHYAGIEDGRLISHIRTYKYGQAMGNKVLVHNVINGSEDLKLLNYAEAAVFNRGCLGRVMWATDDENDYATLKKSLAFFRQNEAVFTQGKPVAKIALYRCSESETGSWADSWISRYAIEQVLIKNSIQYDYIINDTLENLHDYELLICPNTSYVSDKAIGKISKFIKNGGKLLCTEQSFVRDGYGRKRLSDSDMGLNGERDSNIGSTSPGACLKKVLHNLMLDYSYADNVSCLPCIDYAVPFKYDPRSSFLPIIGKEYFAEPGNASEILELLRNLLPDNGLEIVGPENVICGLFDLEDGHKVVHVLDYDAGREVNGVEVSIRTGAVKPQSAVFKSLDFEVDLPVTYSGDVASCTLPPFKTYGFVQIRMLVTAGDIRLNPAVDRRSSAW